MTDGLHALHAAGPARLSVRRRRTRRGLGCAGFTGRSAAGRCRVANGTRRGATKRARRSGRAGHATRPKRTARTARYRRQSIQPIARIFGHIGEQIGMATAKRRKRGRYNLCFFFITNWDALVWIREESQSWLGRITVLANTITLVQK
jgi:hypothetical protein